MVQTEPVNAIPQDTALQLCAEIRQKYQCKWYTAARWQCWGCVRFSKGDPAKMCVGSRRGLSGNVPATPGLAYEARSGYRRS